MTEDKQKRKISTFIIIALAIGLGVSLINTSQISSELARTRASLDDVKGDLEERDSQIEDIVDKIDEVRSDFDDLESAVSDFSDGYSNWRDVVRDVEDATSTLGFAISSAEQEAKY